MHFVLNSPENFILQSCAKLIIDFMLDSLQIPATFGIKKLKEALTYLHCSFKALLENCVTCLPQRVIGKLCFVLLDRDDCWVGSKLIMMSFLAKTESF